MKSVVIIDPYTVPVLQRTTQQLVGTELGFYDKINLDQLSSIIQDCENHLASDPVGAVSKCNKITSYMGLVTGGVLSYDARIFNDD